MKKRILMLWLMMTAVLLISCGTGEVSTETSQRGKAPIRETVVETGEWEQVTFLSSATMVTEGSSQMWAFQYDAKGNVQIASLLQCERELHRNFLCDDSGRVTSFIDYENGALLGSATVEYHEDGRWVGLTLLDEKEEEIGHLSVSYTDGLIQSVTLTKKEKEVYSQEYCYGADQTLTQCIVTRGDTTQIRAFSYDSEGLLQKEDRSSKEGIRLFETTYRFVSYRMESHRTAEAVSNRELLFALMEMGF